MTLFILSLACVDYELGSAGEHTAVDSAVTEDTGSVDTATVDTAPPPAPAMLLDPTWIDYGLVVTGVEIAASFQVISSGTAPLQVDSIDGSGLPAPFTVTLLTEESWPVILDPSASLEVVVTYTGTPGTWLGQVNVASNDPAGIQSVEVLADTCENASLGEFLVTPGPDADALQLVVSNGDGTFAAPVELGDAVGEAYTDPLIGDFDGDGESDVFARGEDTGKHYLLSRPVCEGSWTTTKLVDSPIFKPTAVGDLDGDGLADVVGWTDDLVGVTGLGQSDGSFTWITGSFDPSAAWSNYIMIAGYHAVDVTGDTLADLVLVEYESYASSSTGVHVLAGQGDGTFGIASHVADLDEASNGADIADVDGDGYNDLVAGLDDDGDAGVIYLMRGSASGLANVDVLMDLEPGNESGTNNAGQGSLYLWDWDGDGNPDLLSAHRLHNDDFKTAALDLMVNDGTGAFGSPKPVLTESQMPSGLYLAVP